uniref:Uncharacterized protein n=1 Tax=Anguilla anguilla TaxID=7936 RepID=A0A0E9V3I2_ANGAN
MEDCNSEENKQQCSERPLLGPRMAESTHALH